MPANVVHMNTTADAALTAESVAMLHHTWNLYRDHAETLAAVRIDADQAVLDMFEHMPRYEFTRLTTGRVCYSQPVITWDAVCPRCGQETETPERCPL